MLRRLFTYLVLRYTDAVPRSHLHDVERDLHASEEAWRNQADLDRHDRV